MNGWKTLTFIAEESWAFRKEGRPKQIAFMLAI
jgi:hypothetical protein